MVNLEDYFKRLQQDAAKNDNTKDDEVENGHDINGNNHPRRHDKPDDPSDDPSLPINPS